MPKMSEKQAVLRRVTNRCLIFWPGLWRGYLWQQLEAVLHHHRWSRAGDRPTPRDGCKVSRRSGRTAASTSTRKSGFIFRSFPSLGRVNSRVGPPVRGSSHAPWKELLDTIDKKPVAELQLTDPAEIGFACGALIKRFSGAYYKAMNRPRPTPTFSAIAC